MSRVVFRSLAAAVLAFSVCFMGCEPQGEIGTTFKAGDTATYKVTKMSSKEVKFEQPSLDKSKIDQVSTEVAVTFDQKVETLNEDGSAVLGITIKGIKYYSKGKKGVNYDYDSSKADAPKDPLAGLIGQSYKISIAADGAVKVADISEIQKKAVTQEAKALIREQSIIDRHHWTFLPEDPKAVTGKGATWTKVVSTPKGALNPKAFEKAYTIDQVKKEKDSYIATVSMVASPTDKKPEGGVANGGGLGFMAGAFDTTESYTGGLVFDLTSGKVLNYSEEFKTAHVVAEEAKEGKTDKGPDVLTITFTSASSVEQVK